MPRGIYKRPKSTRASKEQLEKSRLSSRRSRAKRPGSANKAAREWKKRNSGYDKEKMRELRSTPEGREASNVTARKTYANNRQKYIDKSSDRQARKHGYMNDEEFSAMMKIIFERQGNLDCYTGDELLDKRATPPNTPGQYEDEHVWPESDGGAWDETNMACAGQSVNGSKHDKDPRDLFTEHPEYLENFLKIRGPLDAIWFTEMVIKMLGEEALAEALANKPYLVFSKRSTQKNHR